ncbi:hypothetical protein JCM10449v2_003281 [Rhodotorula kratochvilovae]
MPSTSFHTPVHPSSHDQVRTLGPRSYTASTALPDELLEMIFRLLPPDKDGDYRALYRLCLVSRRFCAVAQPFLWEVISIQLPSSPAEAFVGAATTFGQYTRHFELTAASEVDGQAADLASYLPALRSMGELRVLQVDGISGSREPRWITLPRTDHPYLEHFGLVNLGGLSFPPSLAANLISLDLSGSGYNPDPLLVSVCRKMPNLRALAVNALHWSVLPGHLLPQLDMLQLYAPSAGDRAYLVHAPHDAVPLLLSLPISNRHGIQIPTFPFHLHIDAIVLDGVNHGHGTGVAYLVAYLARLTELVKQGGVVQSLWLPRDLEDAGSPTSADAQKAWDSLCAAAEEACVPGRLVGGAEEPSPLVGGRLSWAFWEHAKALRARGET